jgi:osmotically-inducible protein OsmY
MQWQTSGYRTGRRDMSSSGGSCSVGSILGSAIGSWVCGALSGASLMYFFDPDRGARRRHSLLDAGEGARDAARDTAGSVGERVSDAFSGASDAASGAAGRLSAAAGYAANRARKTSSRWFGHAGDSASHLYDRGADLYDRASDATSSRYRRGSKSLSNAASSAYDRAADYASGMFHRDDDHHAARTAGISLGTGLLFAAVGVGLMYFFDPRQGNRRRAMLRERFVSAGAQSRRAAQSGRRYATHLSNQARGVAHDARQMLQQGNQPVPDDRLVARVRSVMGRCVTRAGALRVAASNGNVVLSGPLPASEVDGLLACVREVPGVASIENRLQVQGTEQPAVG